MSERILFSRRGSIGEIRLNRPDKLNALDDAMYLRLAELFDAAAADSDLRCLALRGAGGAFCSGSDIARMERQDLASARTKLALRHRAIRSLAMIEKPVVAAVEGAVAGIGASLAMACDLIVASRESYFLFAFRNVGLVPDGGAIHLLAQRVGTGRARDLVFTGRRLPAEEALAWGLVDRVVEPGAFEATLAELTDHLACGPTLMFGLAKRMMAVGAPPGLDAMLDLEGMAAGVARLSDDHTEGTSAFRERRKPRFKGS